MADRRTERTRRAIRGALLRLLAAKPLAQITVAELAAEAGISRSTFYAHCPNTHRAFTSLVREFLEEVRPLPAQLRCGACSPEATGAGATPFCVALTADERWAALVRDPLFLPTVLELLEEEMEPTALAAYRAAGADEDEARALYRFQMTGCYTAALAYGGRAGWPRMQAAIDTFIRGGLAALRAR